MRLARIVRTLGVVAVLILNGIAPGCGAPEATPVTKEDAKIAKEDQRKVHQELKEARKAGAGRQGR